MKRLIIILLELTFIAGAFAADVTRYVDTDTPAAKGDQDGTTWDLAYDSGAAWDANEATDITGVGNHYVYFRASSGTADTSQMFIDSDWTTDATHGIYLLMDGENGSDQHSGVWDANLYRLEVSNAYPLYIRDDHVTVRGLQIRTPAIDGGDHVLHCNYQSADATIYIEKCIIRGANDVDTAQNGINTADADGKVYISNNIIYDFDGSPQSRGICADGDEVFIHNNTIHRCFVGISDGSPSDRGTVVKNNICIDAAYSCYYTGGSWDANSCNNLSDDTTAPGDASVHSVEPTFVDKANYNFHLASNDTNAKDAGADLDPDGSGFYNVEVDIDGDDRDTVGGGTWDIGADEYDQSGSTPISAIFNNYRRRRQ